LFNENLMDVTQACLNELIWSHSTHAWIFPVCQLNLFLASCIWMR
jgi:hypothetical protein